MSRGRKRSARTSAPQLEPSAQAASKLAFEVRFTPDAAADIRALDGSVRQQLRKVLEKKLAIAPEAYGLPLRGPLAGYWKHPFGNHRVIYRIYPEPAPGVVVVCTVGVRKQRDAEDVYRQLESVARTGRLAGQLASVLRQLLPPRS